MILLVNGKTGKPVSDDRPSIVIDHEKRLLPIPNAHGQIIVSVGPQSHIIRILPNWYADCRSKDSSAAWELEYPIETILSKGIVGDNLCGDRRRENIPGVFVLFVRPRTLIEKWKL
jgi:hypothetical protein